MWNPIKYPHLEWFQRDNHCISKGPSFKWAPWKTLPLMGSRLHLKVPRHSPLRSAVKQYDLPFGKDPVGQSMGSYSKMAMAKYCDLYVQEPSRKATRSIEGAQRQSVYLFRHLHGVDVRC